MLRPPRLFAALLLMLAGCQHRTVSDPPPGPRLTASFHALALDDVTERSGIRFQHHPGAFGRKWFPETNGAGAAIFDYDGDRYPDIFLVNDRDWSAEEMRRAGLSPRPVAATPPRLFRNRGDGTFEDVTVAAGVGVPMYGMGCAVGDYNNDGRPDLFVSGVGRGWLFRNDGGRFREIAERAGVKGDGWGSGCAWADYDRDGRLDLFVSHYVRWDPREDAPCDGPGGRQVYCGPNLYKPEPCRLYHQGSDGRFTDASEHAGIWGDGRSLVSKALGVSVSDVDKDGWPDFLVANDTEANFLFRNNHNGTFTEEGTSTGMALPVGGVARSGMGIDTGDWNASGRDSILVGNFVHEMLGLYQPDSSGLFTDVAQRTGVAEPSRQSTTFGCLFVDLNNDGWLDIATANGHIDDKAEKGAQIPLRQRPQFFINQDGRTFREAPLFDRPLVGRGLAAGDYDRDGAVDLLITTNGGAPILLRNRTREGNALRLILEGAKSNRSAIGARVEVTAGGRKLYRQVKSGSSYLCASELPLTIGLAAAEQTDQITIHWPSGRTQTLRALAAGREYRIREGSPADSSEPLRRVD